MARLPGVRAIDRYGEHFEGDACGAMQELYNDLATSAALSEVHIVPVDLDPDRIDPITGAGEAPILTFDEVIVGRRGGEQGEEGEVGEPLEEIEIHAYRLMRSQLAWLREHHPTEDRIEGSSTPRSPGPRSSPATTPATTRSTPTTATAGGSCTPSRSPYRTTR